MITLSLDVHDKTSILIVKFGQIRGSRLLATPSYQDTQQLGIDWSISSHRTTVMRDISHDNDGK